MSLYSESREEEGTFWPKNPLHKIKIFKWFTSLHTLILDRIPSTTLHLQHSCWFGYSHTTWHKTVSQDYHIVKSNHVHAIHSSHFVVRNPYIFQRWILSSFYLELKQWTLNDLLTNLTWLAHCFDLSLLVVRYGMLFCSVHVWRSTRIPTFYWFRNYMWQFPLHLWIWCIWNRSLGAELNLKSLRRNIALLYYTFTTLNQFCLSKQTLEIIPKRCAS